MGEGKPVRTSGFPSPAEEWLEPRLRLEDLVRHPESTFFARMRGTAMHGDGIFDGDILVVDRALEPAPGALVVAYCNGEMVVRRLTRKGGRPVLTATDGSAPAQLDEEAGDLLWGVVCHAIRSFV